MPFATGTFKPLWWLKNPHLQTLWPSQFRQRPKLPLTAERIELPDGDFLDLAWMPEQAGDLCLLLHGLEGSLQSHYCGPLLQAAHGAGKHTLLMHFRGCSGEPNRLTRRYHSGETGDLLYILQQLKQRYPRKRIHVIGVSLGGNVLLKYLGESGDQNSITSAVAISVPFDLAIAAKTLAKGTARIYQRHLLNSLQHSFFEKASVMELPIQIPEKHDINTLFGFDDQVTAPLHGFEGALDYYTQCSSRQFIPAIRTPTLIIHAQDDPFMTQAAIPTAGELPDCIDMELSPAGGHVGFIQPGDFMQPAYWLDERVYQRMKEAY